MPDKALEIDWRYTQRGFRVGSFLDRYHCPASIQKSSLASEDAIWLGLDEPKIVDSEVLGRMHLSREQVAELIPVLQHFVDTGELPEEDANV